MKKQENVDTQEIPTILSLDLGSMIGFAVYKDGKFVIGQEKFLDLPQLLNMVRSAIVEYEPGLILIPYPTSFYSTIVKHAKQMGIVCLLGEYHQLLVIEVGDSHAKKIVFETDKMPKGQKKISKQMIMNYYKTDMEHAADAVMFIDCYLIDEYKVRIDPCILS